MGSKWDSKVLGTSGLVLTDLRYKVGEAVYLAMDAAARTAEWRSLNGSKRKGFLDKVKAKAVREQAEKTGMSCSFVRKFANIYIAGQRRLSKVRGFSGHFKESFRSVSNRPLVIHRTVTEELRNRIVSLRTEFPTFGSAKIRLKLIERGVDAPCCRTIDSVMRLFSLMDDPKRRRRSGEWERFEMDESNDMWQIDYKTWADGVHSIWVLDDCSRAILAYRVEARQSAAIAKGMLEEAVAMYGKPKVILSDNGTEFKSWKGESKLDEWCEEMGIEHKTGKPYHPQTQGKIERSHSTAKAETPLFGSTDTLDEARATFEKWIQFYNVERPHQAIDYDYPLIRYITMHPRSGDLFVETLD